MNKYLGNPALGKHPKITCNVLPYYTISHCIIESLITKALSTGLSTSKSFSLMSSQAVFHFQASQWVDKRVGHTNRWEVIVLWVGLSISNALVKGLLSIKPLTFCTVWMCTSNATFSIRQVPGATYRIDKTTVNDRNSILNTTLLNKVRVRAMFKIFTMFWSLQIGSCLFIWCMFLSLPEEGSKVAPGGIVSVCSKKQQQNIPLKQMQKHRISGGRKRSSKWKGKDSLSKLIWKSIFGKSLKRQNLQTISQTCLTSTYAF